VEPASMLSYAAENAKNTNTSMDDIRVGQTKVH